LYIDFGRTLVLNFQFLRAKSAGLPRKRAADEAFFVLFCLWWVLLIIFRFFPDIDIAFARMFFLQQECLGATSKICGFFPYGRSSMLLALRRGLFTLPYIAAGVLCVILVLDLRKPRALRDAAGARRPMIALGALIVGPVMLVNLWLKAFSGRPRPFQTDLFGGRFEFQPAGSFAGQCLSNCSFVSGEAAAAGWLLCLVVLIPGSWRGRAAVPLAAASFLMAAMRIPFGAHYLSDVTLGWLSSVVVFAGLFALAQKTHG
jgi:lipid A 4'-phosphatase